MCTVIVVNHHYKDFPLIVAANRDEDFSRPSSEPVVLTKEPHVIVGGKDEVKGGTWLGVNKESLFVTGTNQGKTVEYASAGPITLTGSATTVTLNKKEKLRSRGLLIKDALQCKTLKELIAFVEEINPAKYNKFNLVFGNSESVFVAHSYLLHSMVIRELPKGIHVINSNMQFSGEDKKAQYVHASLDNATLVEWPSYYKLLKKTLANTKYGVRIKPRQSEKTGKFSGHCTRSSTILVFSDKSLERYKFYDRTGHLTGGSSIYHDYIDMWRNPDAEIIKKSPKDVISMVRDRMAKTKCTCSKDPYYKIVDKGCPFHGEFSSDALDKLEKKARNLEHQPIQLPEKFPISSTYTDPADDYWNDGSADNYDWDLND